MKCSSFLTLSQLDVIINEYSITAFEQALITLSCFYQRTLKYNKKELTNGKNKRSYQIY